MKWSQPSSSVGQQLDVARVAFDERVARDRSSYACADRAVLREVVEADDLVPAAEQLLHDVAADEPGRAGDQHLRQSRSSVACELLLELVRA